MEQFHQCFMLSDRFGRVSVSAFVVGNGVDCFDGDIFDFVPEAFRVCVDKNLVCHLESEIKIE